LSSEEEEGTKRGSGVTWANKRKQSGKVGKEPGSQRFLAFEARGKSRGRGEFQGKTRYTGGKKTKRVR